MKARRTWGASEQKRTAASQGWKCAHCSCMLPPEFELDHIIPLFEGGPDDYETNSQALCPNCHACKTQLEGIRKRKRDQAQREERIQAAWHAHVELVSTEEREKRKDTVFANGKLRCNLCNQMYFKIFKHDCKVLVQRIESRLLKGSIHGKKHTAVTIPAPADEHAGGYKQSLSDGSNPFLCYEYVPFKPASRCEPRLTGLRVRSNPNSL